MYSRLESLEGAGEGEGEVWKRKVRGIFMIGAGMCKLFPYRCTMKYGQELYTKPWNYIPSYMTHYHYLLL